MSDEPRKIAKPRPVNDATVRQVAENLRSRAPYVRWKYGPSSLSQEDAEAIVRKSIDESPGFVAKATLLERLGDRENRSSGYYGTSSIKEQKLQDELDKKQGLKR